MRPTHSSSGDLIADRRFEWARDHAGRGDFAAAADLLLQSLEIVPGYASAWFVLGEIRAQLGDRAGAEEAFRKTLALDPADRRGALLQLMRLGAAPVEDMPPAYVRALFDGYAPVFDRTLVDRLDYCGPGLLFHAVMASGRPLRFKRALDLEQHSFHVLENVLVREVQYSDPIFGKDPVTPFVAAGLHIVAEAIQLNRQTFLST